jgi:L-rhamnose-H+ transport protein
MGFLLTVLGGFMVGSFSLPMKKTTRWAWENTWLVWAFTALLILPWLLSFITVPDLFSVYAAVPARTLAMVWLFGLGWGMGAVLFGQGIALIGMSLGFAISIGLTSALGSLVPMMSNPSQFLTPGGATVTTGIAIMVLGVMACAKAGGMKEKQIQAKAGEKTNAGPASKTVFAKGLLLCVLSGLFNPMINFAFAFGGKISSAAVESGASGGAAVDAIWSIALLGGFAANLVYCSLLLFKNRNWNRYRTPGTASHWPLAMLMGALWFCSLPIYGRGAVLMGSLGISAGWGIYMGLCVLISNLWGLFTGEWKEGHGKPLRMMIIGQALLLSAIIIMGIGNALGSAATG